MSSNARYKIHGVAHDGKVFEHFHNGSPPESYMLGLADRRKYVAVIRYFPSKKGWVVWDTRRLQAFKQRTFTRWSGFTRLDRRFPNEDSAIMAAKHLFTR